MTTLLDLRNAIGQESTASISKKIILLGKPKSGKSVMAATIAKAPEIKRIFYFDLENSVESIMNAPYFAPKLALTEEELAKVIYVPVKDTHEVPLAAETMLKCFTARADAPVTLCTSTGKVGCKASACKDSHIPFSLQALTEEDAVIIDSGSQLADSILSMEMLISTYKDLRKYYGAFTIESAAILSGIQAAKCSVVMVTHLLDIMTKPKDPKVTPTLEEIVPLFGSSNFSKNKISKYFGWVILTEQRNGKFLTGSSPTFKAKMDLGNRAGMHIENYPEFNLSWIYKPVSSWPEPSNPTGSIVPKLSK